MTSSPKPGIQCLMAAQAARFRDRLGLMVPGNRIYLAPLKRHPQSRPQQRGVVLLEVVLALVLFVGAAVVIGSAMTASLATVERLRLNTHAADLAITLLSELQMGRYPMEDAGPTPWESPFEDWTWQIEIESAMVGDTSPFPVKTITVTIRHQTNPYVYRLTQLLPATPAGRSGEGTVGLEMSAQDIRPRGLDPL